MQRVDLDDKKCATCRWWQGEREVIFWNKKPFKVECADKGDCPVLKSTNRSSRQICPNWVKWEKLG